MMKRHSIKLNTQQGKISLNHAIIFLLSLTASIFIFKHYSHKPIRYSPGSLVPEEPTQTKIEEGMPWKVDNYTIVPVASFSIRARVLHTKAYSSDREAELSPIDLALGWGPMSDQAVLDKLSITQYYRWYYWSYEKNPPIPTSEIISHSGNMHMIPADSYIEDELREIQEGDIVRINGYLVNIHADNNYHWISSTSRTDTGQGSCEVVWVQSVSIEKRP